MLISIVFLAIITAGGCALTYLLEHDEPLMWRLAAGCVAGSAVYGTLMFVIACTIGFSTPTIAAALVVTLLPVVLLRSAPYRSTFKHDWAKAKGKLEGVNYRKLARFAYYLFFFVLFWMFFGKAMYEMKDGIYTGGSQNLGDLPFHLGAIFSFTDASNFPPQNPSWAGAKFAYPFVSDLITACFVKVGADVPNAMFVQNMGWAMSLFVLVERFTIRVTANKLAGRFAPALLFLSGGLGFIWAFKDYWTSGKGLFAFLNALPHDYTISDSFRWGNSMVVLFMTQRSILLGMPITILVLGYLWKVFTSENDEKWNGEKAEAGSRANLSLLRSFSLTIFIVGLLAGTLPLIHLHSLGALFVVTASLLLLKPAAWRQWVTFGVGVAVIAVPELAWSLAGAASDTSKFFGWHFGWDSRDTNIVWFWIKNTGIIIPVIAAGLYVCWTQKGIVGEKRSDKHEVSLKPLVFFYIPFIALFVISNVAKLAPWEWDNIKVLIYWFVGSIPLVALALAWAWEKKKIFAAVSAVSFVMLILAGSLDVWRTASGQVKMRVFDDDAVRLAYQLKEKTEPNALFVNAPTYNSAVVLTGRQSLMRYSGHLSSHGIDYAPREADVKTIYQGTAMTDGLLKKYNADYVLISPEERNTLKANEDYFRRFPVVAESGQYRVYKVK